ncbi:MAG: hypothetical protein OEU26_01595 [Candidatus Tectomicrobia bacterium]|nr:hypothetical protein [Candidatus Tectomicrobia bacterium]
MNGVTLLPPLLQDQLKTDEAVTILKRMAITETIVDGQFVAATPKAAQFYGYPTVEEFRGVWQSMTQSLDDYKRTVALSVCRLFGEDIPTHYIHRLLGPHGHSLSVCKHTQELAHQGELYWVTRIQAANTAPDLPDLNRIAIPKNIERYRSFTGTLSVAEVEAVLAHFGLSEDRMMTVQNIDVMVVQYLDLVRKKEHAQRRQTLPLLIGQPITKLPYQGGYLLECQACGVIWTSKRVPLRCNGASRCKTWRTVRHPATESALLQNTMGEVRLTNPPHQHSGQRVGPGPDEECG